MNDNPGLSSDPEAVAARARIRGQARQQLYRDMARNAGATSWTQRLKDHDRADARARKQAKAKQ